MEERSMRNKTVDGDQLWGVLIKEMSMVPLLMAFHPRTTMLGGAKPMSLSNHITLTAQAALSLNNWLQEGA